MFFSGAVSDSAPQILEPSRSINHFEIGADVIKWPYSSANSNATELCVLNTDAEDPPCIDIYTNVATPLGDAYFFFPMMYNHFSKEYAQGPSSPNPFRVSLCGDLHS